jgi:hypothetical protein
VSEKEEGPMKSAARFLVRIVVIAALLAVGFAIGFPVGRDTGFVTGCEWAMVQASIVAKEAGKSMPVTFEDGQMHIVVRQPEDLYLRARERATLGIPGVQMAGMKSNERLEVRKLDN